MFLSAIRRHRSRRQRRSASWSPRVERVEPRTLLSAVNWTGDGNDSNWDTAANWNTNAVPGPSDDVTINVPVSVVHSANVNDSINSLNSNFALTISGGSLSIAAASTINSTLSIVGGTLTGAGDLSVSQLVTLTQGTLSGSGALNANGGMMIDPSGNSAGQYFFIDGRTVNNAINHGAVWVGSNSNIQMSNGAVFHNFGNFDAAAGGVLRDGGVGAPSSFVNEGLFSKLNSFSQVQIEMTFDVAGGVVDVQTGKLELEGGGSSTNGEFDIDADATLELDSVFTFDSNTTINGAGTLSQNAFTTNVLPGDYDGFEGPTQILEGTLQVDGSLHNSPVAIGSGALTGKGTTGAIDGGAGAVHPGDASGPGHPERRRRCHIRRRDGV